MNAHHATAGAFSGPTHPVVRLGHVAKTHREKVTPLELAERSVMHYSIPAVQVFGHGVVEDGSSIDSDKLRIASRCVLISRLNPRKATVCIAEASDELTVASTEFVPLATGVAVDDSFVAYLLRTTGVTEYLDARTESATRSHQRVDPETILRLGIPWPDNETRSAVVDYLDHETAEIDALVSELDTARTLIRERGTASFERQIVTEGPPLTELRRHRPVRKTGTSVNGAPWPAVAGHPGVLKTGAASQREYRPQENKAVIDPAEQARLTTPVEADRVLVNRANTPSNVGAAAYVADGNPELFLSDKLWSINFDGINEYFAYALQTRLYQDQASQRAVGTSLSMQNLPFDKFLSIRIPVPPPRAQREICERLRDMHSSIEHSSTTVGAAITLAKERRAALITAAVTGQIDVTAKQHPAAEQLEDDIKELS